MPLFENNNFKLFAVVSIVCGFCLSYGDNIVEFFGGNFIAHLITLLIMCFSAYGLHFLINILQETSQSISDIISAFYKRIGIRIDQRHNSMIRQLKLNNRDKVSRKLLLLKKEELLTLKELIQIRLDGMSNPT